MWIIFMSRPISFLEPFYPEGEYRWQWVLTDSHEIEKLKNISERKSPPDFQNRRSGIKQILLPKS